MKNGSNYPILIGELKKILKRKKIMYQDLAHELKMSESSIKRLMSAEDAPLSKIEAICDVVGISFFDLVSFCKNVHDEDFIITAHQDNYFSKNTNFFYFFIHLYENKKSVKAIKKEFSLSDKSINGYLKKLEELELLERHPNDKIVWKIRGAISLVESQKLSKHLVNISLKNFSNVLCDLNNLKKLTKNKSATFHFGDLYLKEESAKEFFKKFESLQKEMATQSDRECKIYGFSELTKYSLVNAMLPLSLYYEDIPNL